MTIDRAGVTVAADEKRRRLLERWKQGDTPAGDASAIPRRPVGCRVPASTTQQRLWFVDQLFSGQAINNLAYRVDITGALDVAAIGRSLREIVRRHEVLRLHLRLDGDVLVQAFDADLDVPIPVVDLAGLAPDEAEAGADARTTEMARQPFDLTTTPLFRAALVRRAVDRHTLIVVVHHAIFDGWSTGIFLQELVALYAAYARGTEPTLLPPATQYGDYAVWQESALAGERLARDLAHWTEQLGAEPAPLDLPIDFPRPDTQRLDGRVIRVAVPAEDVAASQALATEESATLFMALLALYQLALHRFTGQGDFTIGSPVANRSREELRHLIGPFMNLLVFRTDLDGDPSFRELLARVRQRVRAGFAHQDVPFQALVEQLSRRRDNRRAPLFQVVLALQNFPPVDPVIDGLVLEPRLVDTGVAQAELALFVHPARSGGLECLCEYNVGLFREDTVRHLLVDLVGLVGAVAANPDLPLSQLSDRVALEPTERTGAVPLGLAQERLWILHQLLEDPTALNVSPTLELGGDLDLAALRSSLEALLTKHESLRTAYVVEHGETLQVVQPVRVDLSHQDLSALDARSRDEAVQAAEAAAAGPRFDLTDGRLVRAVALELDRSRSVLLLSLHAIAADLRSVELIVDQLPALYRAARADAVAPAEPAPIQIADFAAWQRRALRGRRRRDHLDHWRDRLAATTGPLDLPAPAVRRGSTVETVTRAFDVPPAVAQRLRALGTPLSEGLLAAFGVVLSRFSHQDAVVVGIRPGNRVEPGSEDVVGCLANTLPFVVRVDGTTSFRQLVQLVGCELQDALAHQEVPVEELAAELGWVREPGCHPLCRALFVVDDAVEPAPDVDLILRLKEGSDRVRVLLEVHRDLVDDRVAEPLMRSLRSLLDRLSADPERAIASVGTVAPAEEDELLAGGDATAAVHPDACLHTLFEEQAGRQPDAAAIVHGDETVTYRELSAWSNRVAHGLVESGARPGEPVALLLDNGAPAIAHMLGALKAQAAFAFLDPAWPPEYLQRALALLRPSVLVVEAATAPLRADLLATVQQEGVHVVVEGGFADRPSTDSGRATDPGDLAYVAFTSGSTGPPKAIPHAHRDLAQFVAWQRRALNVDTTQRVGQLAALTFDVAYCEIFGALCFGATLCVRPGAARGDPAALGRWLAGDRVTVVQIIPRLFRLVWQSLELSGEVEVALASLRHVVFVGEALPRALVASIRERLGLQVRVVNVYGPTEAVAATFHVVDGPLGRSPTVAVGRPIDGRQVVLVDTTGNVCPAGALGEIWIRSDHLTPGYLGDEEETRSRFVTRAVQGRPARFYRTGDLGRLTPDGILEFHGRQDHQVKLHGVRVELDAVEAAAVSSAAVEEGTAVVREVDGAQRLVLYVVPAADASVEGLLAHLREALPRAMVPSAIVELPAIPRTANGKVDRRALPVAGVGRRPTAERVAPRTATESVLAEIVQEVLGVAAVGVHDDFFELGGNSLQAAQIANRVREAFATELPLQAFFEEPTVAAAAEVLDAAATSAADERRAQIAQEVEAMSDAEVAAMLAERRGDR